MIAGTLITIREGLEAFLIVGILLGYLTKIKRAQFKIHIWIGTLAALAVSALLAILFQYAAFQFEGASAKIFEAVVALLAVGVLTWMVLWMQRQSRGIKGELEQKADAAISSGQAFALGSLAFVSVLREGVETALFLSALIATSRDKQLLPGAILGLVLAAGITYLLFRSAIRLNLRNFFIATGIFLILIAAGLIGHSVMALQDIGWLPIGTTIAWNLQGFISNEGLAGRLLHAFFGYEAAPTILTIIAYAIYVIFFGGQFYNAIRQGDSNLKPHHA
ncbi:MAG: FTR1 family protein [Chloroflexi bacterium]|nr:FTR1 family protein [Chloroflexota bacterium]MBI3339217.1 FTR1 family protein [Chloroflexota bacterium]